MKRIPLYLQIIVALVLGIIVGTFLPSVVPYIRWIGNLFMNALCMLIVPIVFFSVSTSVEGICSESGGTFGRIGGKALGMYILTMLLAIATGLCLVWLIRPGSSVAGIALPSDIPSHIGDFSPTDIVSGFIPSNIIYAFAQNNTVPVIFVSILIGYFVTKISPEGKAAIIPILKGGYEITLKIMRVVILFAPLGVFAVVAKQFADVADVGGLLKNMLMYVITVTAGLLIQTFITLPILLRFMGKVNPVKHFRNMGIPLLTAFSTASSGATLPLTLQAVKEKDRVSSKVADFVVSLGATINMNGAALLECVAVIFIAQVYGVELTVLQTVIIAFMSLLCAIGSAGVPMSAMVMMAIILNTVGLPAEGIGLVIGVDRILDMLRTAVNVYGDTCVAVIVGKSEGEHLTIDI
ncbi:MAG: dicarboxylate/amino acid:cation symporter [Bacteroidales bacterium]|nr:dicarboxylate/amino acid:cation symporter [Bacteroidales bacterium]